METLDIFTAFQYLTRNVWYLSFCVHVFFYLFFVGIEKLRCVFVDYSRVFQLLLLLVLLLLPLFNYVIGFRCEIYNVVWVDATLVVRGREKNGNRKEEKRKGDLKTIAKERKKERKKDTHSPRKERKKERKKEKEIRKQANFSENFIFYFSATKKFWQTSDVHFFYFSTILNSLKTKVFARLE